MCVTAEGSNPVWSTSLPLCLPCGWHVLLHGGSWRSQEEWRSGWLGLCCSVGIMLQEGVGPFLTGRWALLPSLSLPHTHSHQEVQSSVCHPWFAAFIFAWYSTELTTLHRQWCSLWSLVSPENTGRNWVNKSYNVLSLFLQLQGKTFSFQSHQSKRWERPERPLGLPSGQSVGYRAELSVSCFAASSLVGLNLGWFTTFYTEQIPASREQPWPLGFYYSNSERKCSLCSVWFEN